MESNEGALMVLARLGHIGDTGGGQPPPPTVPYILHDIAVEVHEWDAPTHSTVQTGSGAEATDISSVGGEGGHC